MDAARSNHTPDVDDDAAYIDVPATEITPRVVTLVPMETGLRAYDHPEGKPHDLRMLEAKVAARRMLQEMPDAEPSEILTLLSAFDLDRDVELPDDEDSDEYYEALDRAPSRLLCGDVERYAEKHHGRVHVGDDWPEVAAEKARRREEFAAENERNRRLADERAAMPRDDAVEASETRDDEIQLPDHALVESRAVERKAPPPIILSIRDKLAKLDADPSSRLVALALALYVNSKTGTARPSYATLARDTGYSKSTIQLVHRS